MIRFYRYRPANNKTTPKRFLVIELLTNQIKRKNSAIIIQLLKEIKKKKQQKREFDLSIKCKNIQMKKVKSNNP